MIKLALNLFSVKFGLLFFYSIIKKRKIKDIETFRYIRYIKKQKDEKNNFSF